MIKTIGADINFIKPSSKQVFEAALFIPLSDTATFESFLNSFENGLFSIWDSAIRTGYITGQSTKEVVKEVLGRVNKDGIREEGLIKSLKTLLRKIHAQLCRRLQTKHIDPYMSRMMICL